MKQYPQLAAELNVPLLGGDAYMPGIPLLNLIKRPLHVEGEYRGRHLKIYDFTRGSGQNSSAHHAVRLSLNQPTTLSFKLGVEGFFAKIGKAVGMQDIETSDPVFDAAFVVKCSDTNFVHGALLPEIRQEFLNIKERWPKGFGSISLNGGMFGGKDSVLIYEEYGSLRKDADRQRAGALASAMSDLAAAIEVYTAP
ncbi:hypothetical protein [Cerasicoccus arenae]|uniref:Uncharacterized protein n=1 Tax=Cerasicoccus arenae TaxID=424488 RepID=A0A8J3DMV0_9BACT|nr:hypothetical protein [Cerasicoccus arenae]MBK1859904.1 hypothetical protein [Cerasicoccus arenae]GHC12715.1 hypothetical protein GCM10007047_32640 [Cerasicoccus arenae]